jgi:hypothetical protein
VLVLPVLLPHVALGAAVSLLLLVLAAAAVVRV